MNPWDLIVLTLGWIILVFVVLFAVLVLMAVVRSVTETYSKRHKLLRQSKAKKWEQEYKDCEKKEWDR